MNKKKIRTEENVSFSLSLCVLWCDVNRDKQSQKTNVDVSALSFLVDTQIRRKEPASRETKGEFHMVDEPIHRTT